MLVTVVVAQQPVLKLTATSVNVSEPGNSVRIDLTRWSTDPERNQLLAALAPPAQAPAAAPAAGAEAPAARGGRGGAQAGGGGARGGRGGAGNVAPTDPITTFTNTIGRAPTIGFIWTNEVTGYAIKHAQRFPSADGAERIVLATNRRLGENSLSWTPAKGTPTPYEFTVLDIRMPPKGTGEAKASLTAKITLDLEAQTIGLENYAATPALLSNVKRP